MDISGPHLSPAHHFPFARARIQTQSPRRVAKHNNRVTRVLSFWPEDKMRVPETQKYQGSLKIHRANPNYHASNVEKEANRYVNTQVTD